MPLPPTPWLNPPDYVGSYLRGAQIGATAAEARARLQAAMQQQNAEIAIAQERIQQQREEAALNAQVRQQIASQNALVQQHRISVDSAYKEAQIGLREQQLDQAKREGDFKIMDAARRGAAQMRINARVQAGEDYTTVMMEEGAEAGPGFGPAGVGAAMRAKQATLPKELEILERGKEKFYRSAPTERYQHIPGDTDQFMENREVTALWTSLKSMEDRLMNFGADIKGKEEEALKANIATKKQRINEIYSQSGRRVPFPDVKPEEAWGAAKSVGGFKVLQIQ